MPKKVWAWTEDRYVTVSVKKPKPQSDWGYYRAKGEGTAPAIFVKLFKGLKREPQRYEIEVKKV